MEVIVSPCLNYTIVLVLYSGFHTKQWWMVIIWHYTKVCGGADGKDGWVGMHTKLFKGSSLEVHSALFFTYLAQKITFAESAVQGCSK